MRLQSTLASLGLFLLIALSMTGRAEAAPPYQTCLRHAVTFSPLKAELNKVYNCARPLSCIGQAVELQVKQIASYGAISQWLVSTTNANTNYSAGAQDAIILNAKNLANANRPANKFVLKIEFFQDVIVNLGAVTQLIGADVTYARCIKTLPSVR